MLRLATARSARATKLSETPDAYAARARAIGTLLWVLVTLAGCGGGASPGGTPTKPVNTSTLVGAWAGSLNGDGTANRYGYSTVVTELRADSTIVLTAANANYGTLTGSWSVSDGKWTSLGLDRDGVRVTLIAPLSSITLTGTWTATSGKTGIFTMTKQP
jgi:hypothetical protein